MSINAARPDLLIAAATGDLLTLTKALAVTADLPGVLAATDRLRGYTLLHAAVTAGQRLTTAMLIAAGAPVDQQDRYGHSPRSYATHIFACRHLLDLFGSEPAGPPPNLAQAEGLLLAQPSQRTLVLSP